MSGFTTALGLLLLLSLAVIVSADIAKDAKPTEDKPLKSEETLKLKLKGKDEKIPHLDRKIEVVQASSNQKGYTLTEEKKIKSQNNIRNVEAPTPIVKPNKKPGKWKKLRRRKQLKTAMKAAWKKNRKQRKNKPLGNVKAHSLNKKVQGNFGRRNFSKLKRKGRKYAKKRLLSKVKKQLRNLKTNAANAKNAKPAVKPVKNRKKWYNDRRKRLRKQLARIAWRRKQRRQKTKRGQIAKQSLNKKGQGKFPRRNKVFNVRKNKKSEVIQNASEGAKQIRNLVPNKAVKPKPKVRKGKSKAANKKKRLRQAIRKAAKLGQKRRNLKRKLEKTNNNNRNMLNHFRGRIRAVRKQQRNKKMGQRKPMRKMIKDKATKKVRGNDKANKTEKTTKVVKQKSRKGKAKQKYGKEKSQVKTNKP